MELQYIFTSDVLLDRKTIPTNFTNRIETIKIIAAAFCESTGGGLTFHLVTGGHFQKITRSISKRPKVPTRCFTRGRG